MERLTCCPKCKAPLQLVYVEEHSAAAILDALRERYKASVPPEKMTLGRAVRCLEQAMCEVGPNPKLWDMRHKPNFAKKTLAVLRAAGIPDR